MADKGCFKKGCFGCLAVVVVLIAIPLLLMAMGFVMGAPEKRRESQVLEQILPELPVEPQSVEAEPGAPDPEGPGEGEFTTDYVERPLMPRFVGTPPTGRVELDLDMGDFTVEPGPADGGMRVEADYDTGTYELEERYEEQEDGTWVYQVRFRSKISWFRRLWGDNKVENNIKIIIPRGRPMEIGGKVGVGQSQIELGGLWLTDVELGLGTGEHQLSFSEPLVEPLPRLQVEGSVGEMRFLGIGNASPATTSIESKVGELRVDLTGDWRQDGEVDIQSSVGDCRVTLPDNAHVDIDRASISVGERRFDDLEPGEPLPEDAPTITLRVAGSVGELSIDR